jgi:hypothetical protein
MMLIQRTGMLLLALSHQTHPDSASISAFSRKVGGHYHENSVYYPLVGIHGADIYQQLDYPDQPGDPTNFPPLL